MATENRSSRGEVIYLRFIPGSSHEATMLNRSFLWLRVWWSLLLIGFPVPIWRIPAMTLLQQLQAKLAEFEPLEVAKADAETALDAAQVEVDAKQAQLDAAKVEKTAKVDAYTAADAAHDAKLEEIKLLITDGQAA